MVTITASASATVLPPGNTWVGLLVWFRPWRSGGATLSFAMAMGKAAVS